MSAGHPTRVSVSLRGKAVGLDVQPSTTGEELRAQIAVAFGESVDNHDLVFRGHVHIANNRDLAHYRLPQGAKLSLLKKIPRPATTSVAPVSSDQSAAQEGLLGTVSQPSGKIKRGSFLMILVIIIVVLFLFEHRSVDTIASSNLLYQIDVAALCESLGNQTVDTSRPAREYADYFPCHGGADHLNTCGIPGMWAVDEAPWALLLWFVTTLLGVAIPLGLAVVGKNLEELLIQLKEALVCCCCIPSKPAVLTWVLSAWFLGSYVVCSYILRLHDHTLDFLQQTCAQKLGTIFAVSQIWVTWAPAWLWVIWPLTFLALPAVIAFDRAWPITTYTRRVGPNRYETEEERPMAVPLCIIGCLLVAGLVVSFLSIPLSLAWVVAGLGFFGGPLVAALCWTHAITHVAQHFVLKAFFPVGLAA